MTQASFDAPEKTVAESPYALHFERIERAIIGMRGDIQALAVESRKERVQTLETANAAYQHANLALRAPKSWAPFVASAFAVLLAAVGLLLR